MGWTDADYDALENGRHHELDITDVDQPDPNGRRNYLHVAAGWNQIETVRWLLDRGASPNGTIDWSPLHAAAEMGYTDICEVLIEAGADLTSLEFGAAGGTPLVLALFYGHANTAEFLARHAIVPRNLRIAAGIGRVDLLQELYGTDQAGTERDWYRPHDDFPDWTPAPCLTGRVPSIWPSGTATTRCSRPFWRPIPISALSIACSTAPRQAGQENEVGKPSPNASQTRNTNPFSKSTIVRKILVV